MYKARVASPRRERLEQREPLHRLDRRGSVGKGPQEAKAGAQALKAEGLHFDVAYTSVLKRAIRTLATCSTGWI